MKSKTKTYISYMANSIVADGLTMLGTKALAAMVLKKFPLNIPAWTPEGLQLQCGAFIMQPILFKILTKDTPQLAR